MQVESEERNLMTQEELINKIATLTGGRCAEKLIFNSMIDDSETYLTLNTETPAPITHPAT